MRGGKWHEYGTLIDDTYMRPVYTTVGLGDHRCVISHTNRSSEIDKLAYYRVAYPNFPMRVFGRYILVEIQQKLDYPT